MQARVDYFGKYILNTKPFSIHTVNTDINSIDWGSLSDRELWFGTKSNNKSYYERTWYEIFRRHDGYIRKHIKCKVHNLGEDDFDDIWADVWIVIVRKLPKLMYLGGMRKWISGVATNRCKEYFRQVRYQKEREEKSVLYVRDIFMSDNGSNFSPEWIIVENEVQGNTTKFVHQKIFPLLTIKEKRIIICRYFVGMNFKEIGRVIDNSETATKTAHHRLLKKIRGWFDDGNI